MIRGIIAFFSVLSIILSSAFAAEAHATSGSSTISDISVKEKDGLTEIRIEVDSPFQYGVYTLTDHQKIVVTLNDVNLGRFTDKILVGKYGIAEISTAEVKSPQQFARLNITLTTPFNEVKPSLKGNSLILSVSTYDVKKKQRSVSQNGSVDVKISDMQAQPEANTVLLTSQEHVAKIKQNTAASSVSNSESEKQEEKQSAVSKTATNEISKPEVTQENEGNERDLTTTMMVRTPFGGYISKKVVSLKQMKFKNIIPQRYDFSCGSASMATIFRYVYNVGNISEEKIAEEMIEIGDPELIRKKGFSLLDMKKYAEKHGFKANGYKVEAEKISKLKIPTIILLDTRGYKHFVVLKGVKEGRVYLADPAAGNRSTTFDEFVKSWDGIVFVVYKKTEEIGTLKLNEAIEVPTDNVLWLSEIGMRNFVSLPGEF
jgi:predicted double-glycine peptidase